MLKKIYHRLINRASSATDKPAGVSALTLEPGGLSPMGDIPRYPPFTKGLPAASPQQLLETQQGMIRKLKHELGFSEELHQELIEPLLESFAAFVHLLPASQSQHHRGAGGLLRHGMEVGVLATRRFHSKIVDGHESGERRKVLEPRWRLACLIAGMCHDIGKPAYDMKITDASGKLAWDIYSGTVTEWMERNQLERYFIHWRSGRQHKSHEQFSQMLTMYVIPKQVMSYLNEAGPQIIAAMQEAISGHPNSPTARLLYDLVMASDKASVSEDLRGQALSANSDTVAVPVASLLIDLMKQLIESGTWTANATEGPLWVTKQGVYLQWPEAAKSLANAIESNALVGMPRGADALLEALADREAIVKHYRDDGLSTYYEVIAPEPLTSKKRVPSLRVVELNGVGLLYEESQPSPVEVHVGEDEIEQRKAKNEEHEEQLQSERDERAHKRHSQKLEQARANGDSMPYIAQPEQAPVREAPGGGEAPRTEGGDDIDAMADASGYDDNPEEQGLHVEEADLSQIQPEQGSHASRSTQESAPAKTVPAAQEAETEKNNDTEAAQHWLESFGNAAELIKQCLIPTPASPSRIDQGDVVLPHPQGLQSLVEDRGEALQQLKPILTPSPDAPAKLVHERHIDGAKQKVLVVSGEAAQHLIALSRDRAETPSQGQGQQSAPETAKEQPPPNANDGERSKAAKHSEPKQKKPAKQRRAKTKPQAKQAPPKPESATPPKLQIKQGESSELVSQILSQYHDHKTEIGFREEVVEGGKAVNCREMILWFAENQAEQMDVSQIWSEVIADPRVVRKPNSTQRLLLIE